MNTCFPSMTPEAIAMRRLRARNRAARDGQGRGHLQARIEESRYLYRVTRTERRPDGRIWIRCAWEGRVQVDGHTFVISRSVIKHGERDAFLEGLRYVARYLCRLYSPKLVMRKVEVLLESAPTGAAT